MQAVGDRERPELKQRSEMLQDGSSASRRDIGKLGHTIRQDSIEHAGAETCRPAAGSENSLRSHLIGRFAGAVANRVNDNFNVGNLVKDEIGVRRRRDAPNGGVIGHRTSKRITLIVRIRVWMRAAPCGERSAM